MQFEEVDAKFLRMAGEFEKAFIPNFSAVYDQTRLKINREKVKSIKQTNGKLRVNNKLFDKVFLPANCSVEKFILEDTIVINKPIITNSIHVMAYDKTDSLRYVYEEGCSNVFDRYSKSFRTNIFVARISRDYKSYSCEALLNLLPSGSATRKRLTW